MPKVIPVLFTSANHLTAAHVHILSDATDLLKERGFDVTKSIVSPVNDTYITRFKHYDKVTINGKPFARTLFSGKERAEMAQATIKDVSTQTIEVSDFEMKHTSVPGGSSSRGYIEHWEMLAHLQREEIQRCKVSGEQPGLYVLVGGADLANGMGNWNGINGMPFLIATRKTNSNPTGKLNSEQNFVSPTAYLKTLGYEGDAFTGFQSGVFQTRDNPYSELSSTKLASCDSAALRLMGNNAFAQLVSILIERSQSSTLPETQIATAKASLELIKSHALNGQLDQDKKVIVERIFKVEASKLPTTAKPEVIAPPESKKDKPEFTPYLKDQRANYLNLVKQLQTIAENLEERQKSNHKYVNVATAARTLYTELDSAKSFFDNPSPESFKTFKNRCSSSIKMAALEFQKHRNLWHAIHPVLKGILGVIAALAIIPALLVAATTKQGYWATFFITPETESAKTLAGFKIEYEHLEKEIEQQVQPG